MVRTSAGQSSALHSYQQFTNSLLVLLIKTIFSYTVLLTSQKYKCMLRSTAASEIFLQKKSTMSLCQKKQILLQCVLRQS